MGLAKVVGTAEYSLHPLCDMHSSAYLGATCSERALNDQILSWITSHLQETMQCPAWLALHSDKVALVAHSVGPSCDILLDGIVAWSLHGSNTLELSFTRAKDVHAKLKELHQTPC